MAAPVANIGVVMPATEVPIDLTQTLAGPGDRALARARVEWRSERGLTAVADRSSYVYRTRRPVRQANYQAGFNEPDQRVYYRKYASLTEVLPGGGTAKVCPDLISVANSVLSPWGKRRAWVDCWSPKGWRAGPFEGNEHVPKLPAGRVGTKVEWAFPMLLTAIDPGQEARLSGIDEALVGGRYLRRDDRAQAGRRMRSGVKEHSVPVLAASRTLLDAQLRVTGERLPDRSAQTFSRAPATPDAHLRWLDEQPGGRVVQRLRIDAQTAYERLLDDMRLPPEQYEGNPVVSKFWTVGPTRYARSSDALTPEAAARSGDSTMWQDPGLSDSYVKVGEEVRDTPYRTLVPHPALRRSAGVNGYADWTKLRLVGRYDAARIHPFSETSAVPLETYAATEPTARDAASRDALGGEALPPSPNLAGYVTQPPTLLTTLGGARPLLNSAWFEKPNPKGPISAIRVRVADVHGPDAVSRERIRQAAQRIAGATGLDVDITVGASPSPQAVDLPAGKLGRPALALEEPWVRKGVATTILQAIDRKSVVLFALILVVCALFVANAASAAVRARRTELGVLACLGWPTSRLFAVVLAEVGLVGLAAGVLGGLLALPIAALAGVEASPARAALAVPAAVLLALLAGLWPALRAARAQPIAAVRPAVLPVGRRHRIRRLSGMAVADLLRVPGRALLGALSVAIGVCALTLLLAATVAFNDSLVGTLLGDAVAIEARTTDYVAVAAMVLLGAAAVADVLFLNLRERAAELATLRATGWGEGAMTRLVGYEGLLIGAVGSALGAGLGVAGVAEFTDALPRDLLVTAALAAAAGTALAGLAALVPAAALRRLAPVPLLAAD